MLPAIMPRFQHECRPVGLDGREVPEIRVAHVTDGLLKVGAAPLEGRLAVEGRAADGHEVLTLLKAPRRQLASTRTENQL